MHLKTQSSFVVVNDDGKKREKNNLFKERKKKIIRTFILSATLEGRIIIGRQESKTKHNKTNKKKQTTLIELTIWR